MSEEVATDLKRFIEATIITHIDPLAQRLDRLEQKVDNLEQRMEGGFAGVAEVIERQNEHFEARFGNHDWRIHRLKQGST